MYGAIGTATLPLVMHLHTTLVIGPLLVHIARGTTATMTERGAHGRACCVYPRRPLDLQTAQGTDPTSRHSSEFLSFRRRTRSLTRPRVL